MAQLLLGKEVTASLNEEIRRKVAQLNEQGVTPKLGIVRIGERAGGHQAGRDPGRGL